MDSMPISSSSLGLKNTQQGFAYSLLMIGGAATVLSLVRLVQWKALSEYELAIAAAILLFALRRLYVGANLYLALLVDVVGPAAIGSSDRALRELLTHRRIWTYERPQGLFRAILYRIAPQCLFLTPPYRQILDGLAVQLIAPLVVLGAIPWLGRDVIAAAAVLGAAAVVRVVATCSALGGLRRQQPPIEVYESPEHLTDAGNPIDLYNHVRAALEHLREKQFQNRFLVENRPAVGVNASTNQCSSDLIVETQPVPLLGRGAYEVPLAARLLACGGGLLEIVGLALLLFMVRFPGIPRVQAFWAAAGVLAVVNGSRFLQIAERLYYTFRFRSDVIWLNVSGSYVVNRIGLGGGIMGLASAEGESIKSDLHVFIRGSRLVTECSPSGGSLGEQLVGTSAPAERTLQSEPRYILSAQMDEIFRERLNWIVNSVLHYRDTADQLRAPDLQSADLQALVGANVQLTQLMHAAAEHGRAQGAAMISGPPTAPLGTPALLPPAQPATPALVQATSPGPSAVSPLPPPAQLPVSPASPTSSSARPAPPPPPPKRPAGTPPASSPSSSPTVVRWPCKKCGHSLAAPSDWAGQPLKCKQCGSQQIVPRS